jgi:hypothetical protein
MGFQDLDVPQCWESAEKGYKGKERYDQDYDRNSSYDPHIDTGGFWIVREEKANDIIEPRDCPCLSYFYVELEMW